MQKIKKLYKKIAAGAMLLLVSVPLFFTVVFLLKQHLVQHRMFEKIEQGCVSTYSFSTGDLQWIKKGKELLIKGKLFDVKTYTIASDSTTVTGLFDEEEELLKINYLQITNSKNESPTPLQLLLLKSFFSPAYTITPNNTFFNLQFIFIDGNNLSQVDETIVSFSNYW